MSGKFATYGCTVCINYILCRFTLYLCLGMRLQYSILLFETLILFTNIEIEGQDLAHFDSPQIKKLKFYSVNISLQVKLEIIRQLTHRTRENSRKESGYNLANFLRSHFQQFSFQDWFTKIQNLQHILGNFQEGLKYT